MYLIQLCTGYWFKHMANINLAVDEKNRLGNSGGGGGCYFVLLEVMIYVNVLVAFYRKLPMGRK